MTSEEPPSYRVEIQDHDYRYVEDCPDWGEVLQYLIDHYQLAKERAQMVKITIVPNAPSTEQVVGQPAEPEGEQEP